MAEWSFLTNHARVLLCVAHDPGARLRDIAASLGITERSACGIVTGLTTACGADNSSAHVSGLMVPAARARGTFDDDTLTAGPLPLGDDDRPCCDWPISP